MIAQTDDELMDWIYCLANQSPRRSGGFLESLSQAAVRADQENYLLLRPALLALKRKYPEYDIKPRYSGKRT